MQRRHCTCMRMRWLQAQQRRRRRRASRRRIARAFLLLSSPLLFLLPPLQQQLGSQAAQRCISTPTDHRQCPTATTVVTATGAWPLGGQPGMITTAAAQPPCRPFSRHAAHRAAQNSRSSRRTRPRSSRRDARRGNGAAERQGARQSEGNDRLSLCARQLKTRKKKRPPFSRHFARFSAAFTRPLSPHRRRPPLSLPPPPPCLPPPPTPPTTTPPRAPRASRTASRR